MLRSTFAGFSMSQLALSASQRALDVTGQNLSNINTEGYTRQRLDLVSIAPTGPSSSSSPFDAKVGLGVLMTSVSQIRDPFLDIQYRNQVSKVGTVDAMNTVLGQIGDVFDESDKSAIKEQLSDIVSQLDKLSKPGQSSNDSVVKASFEVLLNYLHQDAVEINTVKQNVADKLTKTTASDINEILENIRSLNKSIKDSEILGQPALELKDQRNALIDELATYVPINVKTEQKVLGGGITVNLLKIEMPIGAGAKETTDTEGNPVTSITLVDDNEIGKFNMEVTESPENYATIKVQDVNPDRFADPEGNCVASMAKGETQYNALGDGILKGNVDMLNSDGANGSVKGIDYYRNMFDTFVNTLATKMNELNGVGKELFITSDGSATFTASNIKISDAWSKGEIHIKRSDNEADQSSANETILKMINFLSDEKQAEIGTGTAAVKSEISLYEYYCDIQNTQAIEKKSTEALLKNRITVATQASNVRESVTGVNLDEEVMNLMRYQQSYNAASRLMTTMDSLIDKLINGTGVL